MSFFDTADRGALTLTLSRNDPFDADYLATDGIPMYRVCTHKRHSEARAGLGTGFGYLDAEVTSIHRIRPPSSESISSSSQTNEKQQAPPSPNTPSPRPRRSTRCPSRRRTRTSSVLSTPLDTIDEVADRDDYHSEEEEDCDSSAIEPERHESDSMLLVATIERRPLSLCPTRLTFNGCEGPASKYLRRERPFSSTRSFVSITGDLLKWQLSTPTPKLYNSNKSRIAKYCRPFLPDPSKGVLSPSFAVLEIAEGIESDRALDEIIVTFLLTFLL